MQKQELCVGCTVRLKSSLKVGKTYGNANKCLLECLENMKTDERLVVMYIDDDGSVKLGLPGNWWFWYTLDMLDMRTIRSAK